MTGPDLQLQLDAIRLAVAGRGGAVRRVAEPAMRPAVAAPELTLGTGQATPVLVPTIAVIAPAPNSPGGAGTG